MTKFTRHFAATACTALVSALLLVGAVGPATSAAMPLASTVRTMA